MRPRLPSGVCPVCRRTIGRIPSSGLIRRHSTPGRAICPGSWEQAISVVDESAVAEARGYQKAIDALRAEAPRALERSTARGSTDDRGLWDMYDSAADWLETVREDHVSAPTVHERGTAPNE